MLTNLATIRARAEQVTKTVARALRDYQENDEHSDLDAEGPAGRSSRSRRALVLAVKVARPQLEAMERETQEPPSAREAWVQTVGREPTVAEEADLKILTCFHNIRFELNMGNTTWRSRNILRVYENALTDPYAQQSAATIRLVEEARAEGRLCVDSSRMDETDVVAMRKLQRLIRKTRCARVPDAVKEGLAVVKQAEVALGLRWDPRAPSHVAPRGRDTSLYPSKVGERAAV